MQLMTDHRIRHLPVLEKGQLIGVISIGDVVRQMIIEQRQLIDQLEAYIRG
ncbi:MAG: CBS domain-containing protein [Betaproteobacteria bacterium]|nr:CBS domain-containing protein [Betaproteobacteria bacterium]